MITLLQAYLRNVDCCEAINHHFLTSNCLASRTNNTYAYSFRYCTLCALPHATYIGIRTTASGNVSYMLQCVQHVIWH